MDRAAKLAAWARCHLERERDVGLPREITRELLSNYATLLGFSPKAEASAAADQALTDAGTTP